MHFGFEHLFNYPLETETNWYTDTAHDVKENSVETGTEIIPETHCVDCSGDKNQSQISNYMVSRFLFAFVVAVIVIQLLSIRAIGRSVI